MNPDSIQLLDDGCVITIQYRDARLIVFSIIYGDSMFPSNSKIPLPSRDVAWNMALQVLKTIFAT